jgi:hypothetical protein
MFQFYKSNNFFLFVPKFYNSNNYKEISFGYWVLSYTKRNL